MGISTQMAARELRYTWFEEIRRKYNYNTIAVAHNLNDNIETILINLTRGTGITGLTGIKASGNSLIRPLLFAPRTEIEEYCNTRKIKYREDRSNAETKYVRNKIRHLVIPVLKEINPSIETTLVETAERMTGISEIVNEYIGNLRKEVLRVKKDISIIDTVSLDPYSGNKTILFEIFRPFGISGSNLTDLINIIKGRTGGYIVTSSHRIVRNRKELVITELIEDVFDKPVIISGLKQISGSDFISTAEVVNISEKFVIPADGRMAAFDYKLIKFPLIIRKWRPGDHFYPLGMNKRKKLSDYFTDRKYSLPDKENVRLLESEGKIMWIIGERIDNRFRITKNTKKVLILKTHSSLLSP
jgi:tRNA(Ile)-lysidine synthase